MSERAAVEALEELGLTNYEAQVFVALQRLGEATAGEVADASDVPRSQVYGTADDLAARGFVEVVESSPKRFRPVSLDAARAQLNRRLDRTQGRAFDALASIRTDDDGGASGAPATVRGGEAIGARVEALAAGADERVIYAPTDERYVSPGIVAALSDRAAAGVEVVGASFDPGVRERLGAIEGSTLLTPVGEEPTGYDGRVLVVDDATVLLSSRTDDERTDETALWTADTPIGRILAGFVDTGIRTVMRERP